MTRIFIYDTTLRDGSQGEGVNFSLVDKLQITQRLDDLGIDFIEGGYPLSNPKDHEYFRAVKKLFPDVQAGLTLGADLTNAQAWAAMSRRVAELFPGPRLERSHADFIAAHQQLARVRLLRYGRRRRLPVWVWTVDETSEIARFMGDPRVTTLITNRPDVALQLRRPKTA